MKLKASSRPVWSWKHHLLNIPRKRQNLLNWLYLAKCIYFIQYSIALHLCVNESCSKTTNTVILLPKTGSLKRTKVLLVSVLGANECLGHCDEVHGIDSVLWRCTDVWAKRCLGGRRLGDNFFSDDHLGDTAWTFGRQKLDVWATMTRLLGDKNESLNLGQPQPQESGLFTRSLTVIICLGTHMSFWARDWARWYD